MLTKSSGGNYNVIHNSLIWQMTGGKFKTTSNFCNYTLSGFIERHGLVKMATVATNVAVVINNGSCNTQAGLAGITKPNIVFPSIIGHPPSHSTALNSSIEVGHKAEAKQNTLLVKHPIEHCIITNWDDMLKVKSKTTIVYLFYISFGIIHLTN